MLQSIKELGEYLQEQNKSSDSSVIDILTEKPKVKRVIELKFDSNNNYVETILSEFDSKNYSKYLYKKGAANGIYPSPTIIIQISTKIGEETLWHSKTWDKKFVAWFNKYQEKSLTIKEVYNNIVENNVRIDRKSTRLNSSH